MLITEEENVMTPYAAYLITQDILEQRRREGDRARLVRGTVVRRTKKSGRARSTSPEEVSHVSRPL
ncbi:MAG TPA: hypothetical protein VFL72_07660 [Acidimicrobiia bacterium]|nr:hypothetical protein [Acidimicrobiia bacterium]